MERYGGEGHCYGEGGGGKEETWVRREKGRGGIVTTNSCQLTLNIRM